MGYKLWRLKIGEVRCFISRDVTFNETLMTMMCKNVEKNKEKVQIEMGSPDFGQYSSRQVRRGIRRQESTLNLDFGYQHMRDKERRPIKSTQKFGYVNLICYTFSAIREIDGSKQKKFHGPTQKSEGGWMQVGSIQEEGRNIRYEEGNTQGKNGGKGFYTSRKN